MSSGTFWPPIGISSAFSLLSSRASFPTSPRLKSAAAASISSSVLTACVVSGSSYSSTRLGRILSSVSFGMPVNSSDGVDLLTAGGTAGTVLFVPVSFTYCDSGDAVYLRAACLVDDGPLRGL